MSYLKQIHMKVQFWSLTMSFMGRESLLSTSAVEDSDVYENQVLHGFVMTLIQTTSSSFRLQKP
jgi:hypothetical protein